jgi:hypothetical protein
VSATAPTCVQPCLSSSPSLLICPLPLSLCPPICLQAPSLLTCRSCCLSAYPAGHV